MLPINQWSDDDRPREKLLNKGIQALSDAELIAILISTGTRNQSALDLARSILQLADNNLHLLGKKTVTDLMQIQGIGEAKAISIIAALEIGRRRRNSDLEQKQIRSSTDIAEIMEPVLADLPHEEFWVIFLNRANKVIDKVRISAGGLSGTVVDTRIIIKMALERLASALVLTHNHPSGNNHPSEQDRQITRNISEAAALFDIKVLDHVIIADRKYYSFSDNGIL